MSSADELGIRPPVVSTLNRKLRVAINPHLINKNERDDKSLFTEGWDNVELNSSRAQSEDPTGYRLLCSAIWAAQGIEFLAG